MVLTVDMLTVNRESAIPEFKRFGGVDTHREFGWTATGAAIKDSASSCKSIIAGLRTFLLD